jgi:sec-independent protein translocase protein TatB
MFDIGFSELLVIAIIALIVMGPERLPETVRSIGLWVGRMKQMFANARQELESEVGMDEIHRQLRNEKIIRQLEDSKTEVEDTLIQGKSKLKKAAAEINQAIDEPDEGKL